MSINKNKTIFYACVSCFVLFLWFVPRLIYIYTTTAHLHLRELYYAHSELCGRGMSNMSTTRWTPVLLMRGER